MSKFFIDYLNKGLDTTRPTQKRVHGIMQVQLGIKSSAKEKAAAAEQRPDWAHLNETGRKAARRDEISDFVKSNAQARLSLKKLRTEIKSLLPKMPGREKDDLAGVLQDQEYRSYVRGLPQEQRDRVQRLHPDIAAAVARAPAELSGVSQSLHDELVGDILRTTHGAELAKVAADLEAIGWAEELVREADKEIRSAAEVAHETDFRMWAKPLVDPILAEERADFDAVFSRATSDDLNLRNIVSHLSNES
ncbi:MULTISPECIES: hypothetical protein [unclassified Bradyrhizobium]|uniref:hypothetical protein n=1 Tax=Bradyrhizobium sp. USDA 4541 TaxID=2817704 RepID=UPI0020A4F02D|nr:hypothetical protein [Bradyrhizobium sp. USDA 4541]MCP1852111.1 hypothetical protein [Bradyrhizobium sp. USDA 4541]